MALGLSLGAGLEASGSPPGAGPDPEVRVERRVYLMGTEATLATRAADRGHGLRVLQAMLERLETVEAELSTWRDDSLLSTLNRQPVGASLPHPAPLCGLIGELAAWSEATGGAFDPAVGRLVSAWDLRGAGRHPTPRELDRARRDSGLDGLVLRRDPCRVTRTRDVLVDAGAFGKGAALDRVARDLAGPGTPPWMIDLGGQVAVGAPGAPWPVALASPRRRDEAAVHLELAEGSLATSGGSERDVHAGDTTLGHILDPRTGVPVSRVGSVTVWHERALVADVLSTALYVMGPDAGLAWAEARGVAACVLEPDPTPPGAVALRATAAFRRRFPGVEATASGLGGHRRGRPSSPPGSGFGASRDGRSAVATRLRAGSDRMRVEDSR